jgi:hypothetical protein
MMEPRIRLMSDSGLFSTVNGESQLAAQLDNATDMKYY